MSKPRKPQDAQQTDEQARIDAEELAAAEAKFQTACEVMSKLAIDIEDAERNLKDLERRYIRAVDDMKLFLRHVRRLKGLLPPL